MVRKVNAIFVKVIMTVIFVSTIVLAYRFLQIIQYNISGVSEGFGDIWDPIERASLDCYVINLTKNTERLSDFSKSYQESDLANHPYIRVNAIYGKDIPHEKYVAADKEDDLGAGMVGCFLSHLETYKKFQKSGKPYAMIFEDDAKMDPVIYKNTIQTLHQKIPKDWDMILLGYMDYDETHRFENYDDYRKALHFWGLHGYIINQGGAAKLLDQMKPPFKNQIDHVMSRNAREGKLNIYTTKQVSVWQDAKQTDVQIR